MFASKALLTIFALISTVASAQLHNEVASIEVERDLARTLEPQRGKLCKIKDKTPTEVITYGDGNARKCADDCIANKKCFGIAYNDLKNKCTMILEAMNYKVGVCSSLLSSSCFRVILL